MVFAPNTTIIVRVKVVPLDVFFKPPKLVEDLVYLTGIVLNYLCACMLPFGIIYGL